MKNENKKKDAKQDLLIINAETGLLLHPSTLECVSPNSEILFPNLFGASSEIITLYVRSKSTRLNYVTVSFHSKIDVWKNTSLTQKMQSPFLLKH